MNRPVCCKCSVEMELDQVSVTALYLRHNPPMALEAVYADLFKCPKCGHKTLTRFASCPHWTHFDDIAGPSHTRQDVYPIFEGSNRQ